MITDAQIRELQQRLAIDARRIRLALDICSKALKGGDGSQTSREQCAELLKAWAVRQ